ncbi:hypothetical protein M501DRAFT_1000714 [Patellaria atrata CBS 101060]|uniref:Uncharacterized protein n=1 Tax=Patellaria atrata CBS 101060 TaxID=1346257 RepID=A0A9P4VVB5_9PEZI|nr:hypothetical protein M501DRAFT_1000714 [Patellaria atrata CBS 101060]
MASQTESSLTPTDRSSPSAVSNTNITVLPAPEQCERDLKQEAITIFLSGAIDKGSAIPWQDDVYQRLRSHPCLQQSFLSRPVVLFNPSRSDWDSTWIESPEFQPWHEQVTWELDKLAEADIVAVHLPATSQAPISMMEMSLVLGGGKQRLVVCCADKFWKRGNVEMMAERGHGKLVNNLDAMVTALVGAIQSVSIYKWGKLVSEEKTGK